MNVLIAIRLKNAGHIVVLKDRQPTTNAVMGPNGNLVPDGLTNVVDCNGDWHSIPATWFVILTNVQITDIPCVGCRKLMRLEMS